jgi:hypothetical protein
MRLKSELWVKAYLRLCAANLVPAVVVRRGQGDAGAVYIKVCRLDGTSAVYGPAIGLDRDPSERVWAASLKSETVEDAEADAYLRRQVEFDADIWIVEVEDRAGRHFLGDALVSL